MHRGLCRRKTSGCLILFPWRPMLALGISTKRCNGFTLPETNSNFAPENRPFAPKGNEKVFQPSIFRGELLVSGV